MGLKKIQFPPIQFWIEGIKSPLIHTHPFTTEQGLSGENPFQTCDMMTRWCTKLALQNQSNYLWYPTTSQPCSRIPHCSVLSKMNLIMQVYFLDIYNDGLIFFYYFKVLVLFIMRCRSIHFDSRLTNGSSRLLHHRRTMWNHLNEWAIKKYQTLLLSYLYLSFN